MEDDQQFCLRWNNHQSTLIQNFDTLLESGTLVDCTLAAEGKYLKAHKVVLSACSPYFEGLLSEHYDKHPVFILKDVKFKELKAMMEYMYRGEVNISQEQLTALLKAAESLQIKGLSDNRTGGSTTTSGTTTGKSDAKSAKTGSAAASTVAATASSVDIPHASSGLTIEKNKVPRQSLQQISVSDLQEGSASPQLRGLSSREGSQSPTRKRRRARRRSLGNEDTNASIENHEASNSSDFNISAPALGVAPVADEKSHADSADPIGRSALMQQLTKPADEMIQLPIEKPEPSEAMLEPKSEYLDDQESVEDLTNLDDDMNDQNELEQDNSRAGPSHDPSQHAGLASWHMAGDRSNTSIVGAATGPPGGGDEAFLQAQEAAQAQRDSQGIPAAYQDLNLQPIINVTSISLEQMRMLNQEYRDENIMSILHNPALSLKKKPGRPRKYATSVPLPESDLLTIKKITALPDDTSAQKKFIAPNIFKKKPGRPLKKKKFNKDSKFKNVLIELTDVVKHNPEFIPKLKKESLPSIDVYKKEGDQAKYVSNPVAMFKKKRGRPPKFTRSSGFKSLQDASLMENECSPPKITDKSLDITITTISDSTDSANTPPDKKVSFGTELHTSTPRNVNLSSSVQDRASTARRQGIKVKKLKVFQRKRGRPPKPFMGIKQEPNDPDKTNNSSVSSTEPDYRQINPEGSATSSQKKRGRPPKFMVDVKEEPRDVEKSVGEAESSIEMNRAEGPADSRPNPVLVIKRKRGRPRLSEVIKLEPSSEEKESSPSVQADSSADASNIVPGFAVLNKKRGRPKLFRDIAKEDEMMQGTSGTAEPKVNTSFIKRDAEAHSLYESKTLATKKRGRPRKYLEVRLSKYLDTANLKSQSDLNVAGIKLETDCQTDLPLESRDASLIASSASSNNDQSPESFSKSIDKLKDTKKLSKRKHKKRGRPHKVVTTSSGIKIFRERPDDSKAHEKSSAFRPIKKECDDTLESGIETLNLNDDVEVDKAGTSNLDKLKIKIPAAGVDALETPKVCVDVKIPLSDIGKIQAANNENTETEVQPNISMMKSSNSEAVATETSTPEDVIMQNSNFQFDKADVSDPVINVTDTSDPKINIANAFKSESDGMEASEPEIDINKIISNLEAVDVEKPDPEKDINQVALANEKSNLK